MSSPVRSAFARLRELLDGVSPPDGLDSVLLHLGESRLAAPAIEPALLAEPAGWTRYPQLGGSAELRAAYTGWLQRRFGVRESLGDGRTAVEPTPGTKQAVAVAIALAAARHWGAGVPSVVMPNPYYPTYPAASEAVGARPVFYTLDRPGDISPVEASVRAAGGRATAIVVCNPGNPRGEILPPDALRALAKTAAMAGAWLIVDECYTDVSYGRLPPGYLSLVADDSVEPVPHLVLHSLSKRSGAPGLRSGFAAGDPASVAAYAAYNRACGVSTPAPVNAVAAALWTDDGHVSAARSGLAANWALADELLRDVSGYRRADAGFFLWLPVADDEETARRLWREQALTVMPGRYLADEGADGTNPGAGHVRIALVHREPLMREALTRLQDAQASAATAGPAPAKEQ
ncbi:aminotransferase class I/II-fold pyridoxal phosphate-dependent enzyme [Streptomyces halobius]|uniref:Aminotransferase class I/II-fold pyridoxal phosphate-dependent enzyme n=1 Tax=Streptomyces halobius TaxID=2879846 RepID=A0ABY4MH30_9ACTN|nr:aminotransferase class I/II-fold pyridoxal phosphate-dependent enzyme [Streptomyces halobius]UQA95666.1 aminotransferase class I/II-fold pyridoxal phosphate-dependent enzyme [Streptomyces halobius]